MPRNGAGVYSLPAGNPVVTGTTISSTVQNNTMSDVAVALTNSIAKDGQTTPTANIPMGGFKLTNLGNATVGTDGLNLVGAQNGAFSALTSVSGADTITAAAAPALTAYANGQRFSFVSAGANTGTSVTLNIDGLGAKSITKLGSTALAVGDIPSGAKVLVEYDGTRFQLLNLAAQSAATLTTGATAVTQSIGDNSTKIATTAYADRYAGRLQLIGASVAANALTITINPTVLDFRSATLGSGTNSTVALTSAANLVISSTSTLGTSSGVQSDIAVLAINNAGTIEVAAVNLAGGVDLSETGIISTTAEGGAGGADSATTIYSTTARSNVAYRVVGIVRSTQATAGVWATNPSLIQGTGGLVKVSSVSRVRVHTANGYGSTNTAILRYTTVLDNFGTDITYADSATLGASWTINTPGVYSISAHGAPSLTNAYVGISVNSNQLTTGINSVSAANRLAWAVAYTGNAGTEASFTGFFQAGDVIRAHADGTAAGVAGNYQFSVTRVN